MKNPLPTSKSLVRKPFVSLLSMGALCFSVMSGASAAPLLSEYFDYADGDLLTVSGGAWVLNSGSTPLNVSSGRAITTFANSQDDARAFTPVSSGSLYYGLTATVTAAPSANGSYFATLWDGETGAANDYFGRLQIAQGSTSTKFKLGIINDSGNAVVYSGAEFDLNTTVRIVVKFDFTTMTSTLWINPTGEGSSSVTDSVAAVFSTTVDGETSVPGGITTMGNILLRQASGIGTTAIDGLVVSTSFADVSAVPEPGMIALAALGIGALFLNSRRRRV